MKILAVDDDEIILELLEQVLLSIGYTDITTALSADVALQRIDEAIDPFDCILLDIQMPEMDGIELSGLIRDMPDYRETPVLMITAMSDKNYIDRAFQRGATDYVTKPFDVMELSARIRIADRLAVDWKKKREASRAGRSFHDLVGDEAKIDLEQPVVIHDVDGVIDYNAMQNYLAQLGRRALFGSSVFAIKINEIEGLHGAMTNYEFKCLVTDVAEAITLAMAMRQHLVCYMGGGVFVSVTEDAGRLHVQSVLDDVKRTVLDMAMCYSDGRPMHVGFSVGSPVRMTLLFGQSAPRAIQRAVASARLSEFDGWERAPVRTSFLGA